MKNILENLIKTSFLITALLNASNCIASHQDTEPMPPNKTQFEECLKNIRNIAEKGISTISVNRLINNSVIFVFCGDKNQTGKAYNLVNTLYVEIDKNEYFLTNASKIDIEVLHHVSTICYNKLNEIQPFINILAKESLVSVLEFFNQINSFLEKELTSNTHESSSKVSPSLEPFKDIYDRYDENYKWKETSTEKEIWGKKEEGDIHLPALKFPNQDSTFY